MRAATQQSAENNSFALPIAVQHLSPAILVNVTIAAAGASKVGRAHSQLLQSLADSAEDPRSRFAARCVLDNVAQHSGLLQHLTRRQAPGKLATRRINAAHLCEIGSIVLLGGAASHAGQSADTGRCPRRRRRRRQRRRLRRRRRQRRRRLTRRRRRRPPPPRRQRRRRRPSPPPTMAILTRNRQSLSPQQQLHHHRRPSPSRSRSSPSPLPLHQAPRTHEPRPWAYAHGPPSPSCRRQHPRRRSHRPHHRRAPHRPHRRRPPLPMRPLILCEAARASFTRL